MKHLLDDISCTSWKYEKKINNAMLPLSQLGVTYFAIQKVSLDGHWSLISSDASWVDYSVSHQLYLSDATLFNPQHYGSGIFLTDPEESAVLAEQESVTGTGNGLVIMNKYANECEYFFLGSQVNNKKIINTYFNKMNYIRKFCEYFSKENRHMLHHAQNFGIDLKKWNPSYSNTHKLFLDSFDTDNLSYHPLYNALTRREKECVTYLLKGHTAKETARLLGLSYRTIEYYYEILKTKFHCKTKRDLYKIFDH